MISRVIGKTYESGFSRCCTGSTMSWTFLPVIAFPTEIFLLQYRGLFQQIIGGPLRQKTPSGARTEVFHKLSPQNGRVPPAVTPLTLMAPPLHRGLL